MEADGIRYVSVASGYCHIRPITNDYVIRNKGACGPPLRYRLKWPRVNSYRLTRWHHFVLIAYCCQGRSHRRTRSSAHAEVRGKRNRMNHWEDIALKSSDRSLNGVAYTWENLVSRQSVLKTVVHNYGRLSATEEGLDAFADKGWRAMRTSAPRYAVGLQKWKLYAWSIDDILGCTCLHCKIPYRQADTVTANFPVASLKDVQLTCHVNTEICFLLLM